ncbi:MAG: hypothetical protein JO069_11210, partial [Verrucomicrobia bacterium]|nr:hypothetical protein [Verrucomicrobiota bacterium]
MAKPKFSFQETWRTAVGPYRDLFPYLKPYAGRFFLALLFGAFYGVTSGLLPLVMRYVNTRIFPQGNHHFSDLMGEAGPDISAVFAVCAAIPFIFLLRSLCDYLNAYYMAWVSLRVLADLRCKLFEHL